MMSLHLNKHNIDYVKHDKRHEAEDTRKTHFHGSETLHIFDVYNQTLILNAKSTGFSNVKSANDFDSFEQAQLLLRQTK
jgi:hypothetical protein